MMTADFSAERGDERSRQWQIAWFYPRRTAAVAELPEFYAKKKKELMSV